MITATDIYEQLLAKSGGTPYTVTRTDDGVLIHQDPTNVDFAAAMFKAHIEQDYRIEITLDEARHVYREDQSVRTTNTRSAIAPGSLLPSLAKNTSWEKGTVMNVSTQHLAGVTWSAQVASTGYTFDTRQMAMFIDEVMRPSGWTRKMAKNSRLAIIIPTAILGGLSLIALIVLAIVFLL
jgi:hypothetical protein